MGKCFVLFGQRSGRNNEKYKKQTTKTHAYSRVQQEMSEM